MPEEKKANKLLINQKIRIYDVILRELSRTALATGEGCRITTMFSGDNQKRETAVAAESTRTQTDQRECFLTVAIRSGTHIPTNEQVLHSYGLPEDLSLPCQTLNLPSIPRPVTKPAPRESDNSQKAPEKTTSALNKAIDERTGPIFAAKYLKNTQPVQHRCWPRYQYKLRNGRNETGAEGKRDPTSGSLPSTTRDILSFSPKNSTPEVLFALQCAKEPERNPAIRLDRLLSVNSVTLKTSTDNI